MKYLIILSTVIMQLCFSCKSNQVIGFTSPIPINGKIQKNIDSKLWGSYKIQDPNVVMFSVQDTFTISKIKGVKYTMHNIVEITKDSINTIFTGEFHINKDSADLEILELLGTTDSIIIKTYNPYKFENKISETNNIAIATVIYKANLFSTTDSVIIKKFKDKTYLNTYRNVERNWNCFQLSGNKTQLSINFLTEADIILLNRLMEVYNNSSVSVAAPTMSVFKKFLNLNGFEKRVVLISK